MRKFFESLAFWRNWDDGERAVAVKILGFFVAALAVFVLISTVSYLFHWQQDMSLLQDPEMMDASVPVGNLAGKLGYRTGHLLVCDLFGFGSFALLVILAAVSARLIAGRWHFSLVKTTLITLTGAFVASILLAFIGRLAGLQYAFGGGLGGRCGAQVIDWGVNLFGLIVTGLGVLLLIAAWLFLSSKKFSELVNGVGKPHEKKPKPEYEHETEHKTELKTTYTPPVEHEVKNTGTTVPPLTPVHDVDTPQDGQGPEIGKGPEIEVVTDDTLEAEVKELPPIDNRMDPPEGLPWYKFPSITLLDDHASSKREVSNEELNRNNNKIRAALLTYRIEVTDVKAVIGPTVTLYKVNPAPGVKIADIKKLQEDIALTLKARGVRVVTLPDCVGIEVANDSPSIVPLKSLLNSESFRKSKYELPIAIGYTITQEVKVFDLSDAPHLLIAGATKQGKSVGLNVIVASLLYSKHPSELKFVFIDPKMVEFSSYNTLLHHYLAVLPTAGDEDEERRKAIVKSPKDAEKVLRSLCTEMDERYKLLSEAGTQKITQYNEKYKARKLRPDKGHRFLPYIVTVVDEFADLTMVIGASPEVRAASKSISNSIIRLAQKGRAAGIHVILATQRPSVDVISGLIKSNFPMRIAFRVASRIDSQTILDAPGAEKLIGRGDMLWSAGLDTERIQCGYVSGEEIDSVTDFIGEQQGYKKSYNTPYYLPDVSESSEGGGAGGGSLGELDERFEEAAKMVVTTQRGSTSDLQRKLGMGYAKAGRVMDQLEQAGIVGPQEGSKPRTVLVSTLEDLQTILDQIGK
ncbi:MAG: DNA translocase FtsK [Bacteroidales bacterium]|nr:DNA translocase FtsK [Bacteroidales bacterium]